VQDGAVGDLTERARRRDLRFLRRLTGLLAVALVIGGTLIGFSPGALEALLSVYKVGHEIEEDAARQIGSVMILAGMADTLVLYFWDRLFKGQG
jgi:hypothetical protein